MEGPVNVTDGVLPSVEERGLSGQPRDQIWVETCSALELGLFHEGLGTIDREGLRSIPHSRPRNAPDAIGVKSQGRKLIFLLPFVLSGVRCESSREPGGGGGGFFDYISLRNH